MSSSNNNNNNNRNKKRKRLRLDKEQSKIVIVGSGLAGLSAAIALEQAGFANIEVYERDISLEIQKEGYGLTLSYNPKGPLAALGILEQVAQQDCPSRSHYLFRPDGSILGYFGNAFFQHRGMGQRGNLRVPRKVLRKILVQTLQSTTIHWGHQFVNATWQEETKQYSVEFATTTSTTTNGNGSDNVKTTADLLVAADGIRSAILKRLVYEKQQQKEGLHGATYPMMENNAEDAGGSSHCPTTTTMGLRHIGVRLILGIADFTHPLLNERGFYTLDGKHRLFTMPYQSTTSSGLFNGTESSSLSKKRIMWQLSFAAAPNDDTTSKSSLEPIDLQKYVLETCQSWHPPVLDMIQATPLETIWGTDLMDRDPRQVLALIQKHQTRRLVVVGDALHSMSPFKGQGANQALADGPLLAKWLQGSAVDSAVVGFWRETVQRTAPVVAASYRAANELHSPTVMSEKYSHGFAGIKAGRIKEFVALLEEKKIGAHLEGKLDGAVLELLAHRKDMSVEEETPEPITVQSQRKALELAAAGDTQGLRILSLAKQSRSIRSARDVQRSNKTCLHLAMERGHILTCKWLLSEVGCDPDSLDSDGKTFLDYATNKKAATASLAFTLDSCVCSKQAHTTMHVRR